VIKKNSISWDVTHRITVKVSEHFRGTYRHHLHAGFLLVLLIDLEEHKHDIGVKQLHLLSSFTLLRACSIDREDGGDMFL
jgi:hypothetical protein